MTTDNHEKRNKVLTGVTARTRVFRSMDSLDADDIPRRQPRLIAWEGMPATGKFTGGTRRKVA